MHFFITKYCLVNRNQSQHLETHQYLLLICLVKKLEIIGVKILGIWELQSWFLYYTAFTRPDIEPRSCLWSSKLNAHKKNKIAIFD